MQVVCLELHVDGASIEQAAVFWGAMGALESLTTMELSVYDINAPEEHVGYDFFYPVNQMTQIRCPLTPIRSPYGKMGWMFHGADHARSVWSLAHLTFYDIALLGSTRD